MLIFIFASRTQDEVQISTKQIVVPSTIPGTSSLSILQIGALFKVQGLSSLFCKLLLRSSSMDCLVCTMAGFMMMAMMMVLVMMMVMMVMTMTVMMPEVAMTSSDAQCELKGTGAVVQLD